MTTCVSPIALPVTAVDERPLSTAKALRHVLQLALEMRTSHASGQLYGPTAPDLERYAAPEVTAGAPPDVRSDIYALGALAHNLLTDGPPPVDPSPGVHAFLARCLDPNPDRRWQNVRTVCVELRLLCAAANRMPGAVEPRRSVEPSPRERLSRLEAALESRMAATEQMLTELRATVCETQEHLMTALDFLEDRLRNQARVIEKLDTAARAADLAIQQQSAGLAACNQATADTRRVAEEARECIAVALQPIDHRLDEIAESVDSLHAVAERTDDLLDRVVESIDSLQNFVLERTGDL